MAVILTWLMVFTWSIDMFGCIHWSVPDNESVAVLIKEYAGSTIPAQVITDTTEHVFCPVGDVAYAENPEGPYYIQTFRTTATETRIDRSAAFFAYRHFLAQLYEHTGNTYTQVLPLLRS